MTVLANIDTLDDIATLAEALPTADQASREAATVRQNSLTKPPGALGRLEDIAVFLAGWQKAKRPVIDRAQAIVFAGNHGICAQGVNPFPQEVTAQMVANFEAGGAAINQLCGVVGADLTVIPLELDRPTQDFTLAEAMSADECLSAMKAGADAVDATANILLLGEMGIGNSTVAAALAYLGFGGDAGGWVGRGTGSDDAGLARKVDALTSAKERHASATGLDLLTSIGGREQAAICGAVLEARARAIPVVLDGFICTAATVPLYLANARFLDHCLVGHVSREPGHQKLLENMGMDPILSLDMALGEGSGAAVALGVVRAALACHNGMASFAEAG
ncbi:MAG: nicotinate-nucleotide--dimethylbenzimidazole phosphoribosyltransferase, partial [Pseudomonadota bacterium]